jgi:putative transposase
MIPTIFLALTIIMNASHLAAQDAGRRDPTSSYGVVGFALGTKVAFGSAAYRQYHCVRSEKFESFIWCTKTSNDKEARGHFKVRSSILHAQDGTAAYVNRYQEPAYWGANEIAEDIQRYSRKIGAEPHIFEMPPGRGPLGGTVATWGKVVLEPIVGDELRALEEGKPLGNGIAIDFIGDFARSARTGLPVYRLGGEAGFVWAASYNERGRGSFRFAAVDPSAYSPGLLPPRQTTPPAAAASPPDGMATAIDPSPSSPQTLSPPRETTPPLLAPLPPSEQKTASLRDAEPDPQPTLDGNFGQVGAYVCQVAGSLGANLFQQRYCDDPVRISYFLFFLVGIALVSGVAKVTLATRSTAKGAFAAIPPGGPSIDASAPPGEQPADGRDQIVRHGHGPQRAIQTGVGPVEVEAPKVRADFAEEKIRFTSSILSRWARRTKSLDALLPVLYLRGVPTGDFQEALNALLGEGAPNLSPAEVTRLTADWQADYDAWQKRDLSARRYMYIWADGVFLQALMEESAECMLVLIGATPEGKKELVGFQTGVRESAHSWRELLIDVKRRGLEFAPDLAVGDGALGFWKAIEEVFPGTRHQRCWVHNTANVLHKVARSVQVNMKADLREIFGASTRASAEAAIDMFAEKYGAKYEKAVACLTKDREALLAFFDFPAEHWDHLRTSNPIERVFATVRQRRVRTKGALSTATAKLMVFKLVIAAAKNWRRLKGENKLPKVVRGIKIHNGIEVIEMPAHNAA